MSAPLAINREGQFPAATISFNLAKNHALGAAVAAIEAVQRDLQLPASMQGSFQGVSECDKIR